MLNDYMFRAILQTHNNVLKGLIVALLHLPVKQLKSVVNLHTIFLVTN